VEPNGFAFAVLSSDGSVLAWGNPYYGGNCQKAGQPNGEFTTEKCGV
jgi:hypothetical protein